MILDLILILVSGSLLTLGFIGCIVPAIPGPVLAYLGLLSLLLGNGFELSGTLLWSTGIATAVVAIADYIIPAWGTKKFGGSKMGVWGSTVGLIVGLFIGPVGIILGPFVGAFAFEIYAGRDSKAAFMSGLGSFVGFLFGTVLKLGLVVVLIYYWFSAVWGVFTLMVL